MLWDEKLIILTDVIRVVILSIWSSIRSTWYFKIETSVSINTNRSLISIRVCVSSSFNWAISVLSHFNSSVLVGDTSDLQISRNKWLMLHGNIDFHYYFPDTVYLFLIRPNISCQKMLTLWFCSISLNNITANLDSVFYYLRNIWRDYFRSWIYFCID